MENVLSLLTSLDDSEIQTIQTFLKEYMKSRDIEKKLEKYCQILRDRGIDEVEIESNRISRLRVMGIIDMDEDIRLKTKLYANK